MLFKACARKRICGPPSTKAKGPMPRKPFKLSFPCYFGLFTLLSKDTWLGWYADGRIEPGVAALAEILKENLTARVLDFGCGTGRHTVYLSKLGFSVFGFDWSEASIEAARKELQREGLEAHLSVWDMNQTPLPYPDKYFNAVLAVRVFHHAYTEQVRRSATEIGRITKRGGYLYVEVPTFGRLQSEKKKGVEFYEPEVGTFVPRGGEEAGIPHHFFRKEELVSLFRQFTLTHLEETQDHLCLTAARD